MSKSIFFAFIAILLEGPILSGQIVKGKVQDSTTLEPLSYVNIGVQNQNVGVISLEDGTFQIDLSNVSSSDTLWFSMIGYESVAISLDSTSVEPLTILMKPRAYLLGEIEVHASKSLNIQKFGRSGITKTTTGHGGSKKYGWGGEWGLKITYQGTPYLLKTIRFHARFNNLDSVLFRLNIYQTHEGFPGEEVLMQDLFVTSHKNDRWIIKDCTNLNLLIQEDIIVTMEPVRFWYDDKGQNNLFFTHGKGYDEEARTIGSQVLLPGP